MVSSSTDKILLSADGVPLKKSLNRSLRQQKNTSPTANFTFAYFYYRRVHHANYFDALAIG
jgi:hypothetical protein